MKICKDIIKDMRKEKFGRVIAIGSTLTEKPVKNFGSYIIGKQNLKTLIKLMSLEYVMRILHLIQCRHILQTQNCSLQS